MKRSPLRRKTPLRQRRKSGGPDIAREPRPIAYSPRPADAPRAVMAGSTTGRRVVKEEASQHAGYMDAVRALGLCVRCGRHLLRAVFCHRDAGKGIGLKTDSREGWAGCDDCHALLGGHAGGGRMPKAQRREEETELARRTRAAVNAAGTWPRTLPQWNNERSEA